MEALNMLIYAHGIEVDASVTVKVDMKRARRKEERGKEGFRADIPEKSYKVDWGRS